jgi:hypothetical protein
MIGQGADEPLSSVTAKGPAKNAPGMGVGSGRVWVILLTAKSLSTTSKWPNETRGSVDEYGLQYRVLHITSIWISWNLSNACRSFSVTQLLGPGGRSKSNSLDLIMATNFAPRSKPMKRKTALCSCMLGNKHGKLAATDAKRQGQGMSPVNR